MKFLNKMKKNQKGFTLVEIIVVLVILAVLAAFTIPTMLGFVNEAKGKAYIAEARTVYVAAQATVTELTATAAAPAPATEIKSTDTSAATTQIKSYLGTDVTGTWEVTQAAGKVSKVVYTRGGYTVTLNAATGSTTVEKIA